jgi:hypothetical protein
MLDTIHGRASRYVPFMDKHPGTHLSWVSIPIHNLFIPFASYAGYLSAPDPASGQNCSDIDGTLLSS